LISPSAISTILRTSPKVPYVDETALEKESNELSEESKELLSIYHKTFDDERVSCLCCSFTVHLSVLELNKMIILVLRGSCLSQ